MRKIISSYLLLFTTLAWSQSVKVDIKSTTDSFLLGKPIDVSMCIRHSGKGYFIIPELGDESKFELVSKRVFETKKLDATHFTDSVLLQYRTFDLSDSVQLSLQIGHILTKDTLFIGSNQLVFYQQNPVIAGQENRLLPHTQYIPIAKRPNYNLYWFCFFLLLAAAAAWATIALPKILAKRRKATFEWEHTQRVEKLKSLDIRDKKSLDSWVGIWKTDINKSLNTQLDSHTISQLKQEFPILKTCLSQLESILYISEYQFDNSKSIEEMLFFMEMQY